MANLTSDLAKMVPRQKETSHRQLMTAKLVRAVYLPHLKWIFAWTTWAS